MSHQNYDLELLKHTPLKSAFTPAQIRHYLEHISFPLSLTHPRDATFLQALHRCQITRFPYENLSLHYNPAHNNSIDPQHLYDKFLPDFADPNTEKSRGRGGFCFETCVFFLNILKGLGFTAYPAAARIRLRDHFTRVPAGPFVGPRHVVNLVLLDDGSTWSCDVGFGGDGPTSPMKLSSIPGQDPEVVSNLGAQEIRLRKGAFPDTVRPEANQVWFYEYRNGKDAPWNTYYAFGEAEASSWDLDCANSWVADHPESFQRKQILAVKFIKGSAEEVPSEKHVDLGGDQVTNGESAAGPRVVGKMMLADGVLKRNMGGKTELIKECKTEEDRVQVLAEYFDIHLSAEARQGIMGFETELQG